MNLDQQIASLCEKAITDHVFPGCVVGYIREGHTTILPFGYQKYDTASPVTEDTVYDVASVTKSVITASMALKMIEDGRLNIDDAVLQYIPELDNDYRNDIRIRHLLTYTIRFKIEGGLSRMAHETPDRVFEELCKLPLLEPPGQSYYYTNAPAILLATVVERVGHEAIDVLAKRYYLDALGMTLTTMRPETLPRFQVAPSEIDWRGELRSIVHDEAAWAMYKNNGRLAGDAGLFSTAGDLLKYSQLLLNEGRSDKGQLLDYGTVAAMHTNQIPELKDKAGFGWDMGWSSYMGIETSDQAFGKTGFTGCVMLIDPKKKAALVHLSNAIYPKRPATRDAINAVRSKLADLVFGGLSEQASEAAY